MIASQDVEAFERCVAEGGITVFPTDTVYGIGCDPSNPSAIKRLFLIKGRSEDKPAAVMFFSLQRALDELTGLDERTLETLRVLFPGPITAVVRAEPTMFGLATRAGRLGVRVPKLEGDIAALAAARCGVLQTSANEAGGPDPRRLDDVPLGMRESVNLQLDGGELAGTPSTVIDLFDYGRSGKYELLREGAVRAAEIAERLR